MANDSLLPLHRTLQHPTAPAARAWTEMLTAVAATCLLREMNVLHAAGELARLLCVLPAAPVRRHLEGPREEECRVLLVQEVRPITGLRDSDERGQALEQPVPRPLINPKSLLVLLWVPRVTK